MVIKKWVVMPLAFIWVLILGVLGALLYVIGLILCYIATLLLGGTMFPSYMYEGFANTLELLTNHVNWVTKVALNKSNK